MSTETSASCRESWEFTSYHRSPNRFSRSSISERLTLAPLSSSATASALCARYVEREGKIGSLLKYSEQQNDEIHATQLCIAECEALIKGAHAEENATDAQCTSPQQAKEQKAQKNAYERAQETFDGVCRILESMFKASKCAGIQELITKGCSSSTVGQFMSAIGTRLDELHMVAGSIREHGLHRGDKRRAIAIFDGFLKLKQGAQKSEEPAAEMVKRMLPSMSDQGPDQDGETDQQERARARDARKGTIDRTKRDRAIATWLERQRQLKSAVAARPTIRQYYDEETKSFFESKKLYPPASARV